MRNADLLVLLSFSVSLWFFNHGNVFAAMSLAYPPLVWLLAALRSGSRARDRPSRGAPVWPVWVLAAATVFLAGFRVGLNVRASNVIDVGYSGVIGADRIVHGQSPYGHFPRRGLRGRNAARPTPTARCATASRRTAGARPRTRSATPTGRSPTSPTSRATRSSAGATSGTGCPRCTLTSILFDMICLIGLALVGRRFGGPRLAATLAFAWVAWPFTQYASSSNTNDSIMPVLLVWGFLALTSPVARGAAVALSGWTKFASLLLLPLWSGYPEARRPRAQPSTSPGSRSTTLLVFFVALPRAVAAARRPRLLRPHGPLPDRPRLAVLALGLAAVPREGPARPAPRAARAAGAARRRLARARRGSRAAARRCGSPR